MSCECINWSITKQIQKNHNFKFYHHHPDCEGYKNDKIPRLFYYEEAENCWTPAPKKKENIIDVEDQLDSDEEIEIRFKRVDMTQFELDNLPES